jgi:hypothetical protein
MMVELTDDEWATVLVALDGYGAQKRIEWLDSRDDDDLTEAGSAEWCWQKIYGALSTERNATAVEAMKASLKGELPERNTTANAIGEGETLTHALVDPFGLPTWNDT